MASDRGVRLRVAAVLGNAVTAMGEAWRPLTGYLVLAAMALLLLGVLIGLEAPSAGVDRLGLADASHWLVLAAAGSSLLFSYLWSGLSLSGLAVLRGDRAPASALLVPLGPFLRTVCLLIIVLGILTAALASIVLALLAVASWTPRTAAWLQALGLLLAIPLTGAAAYLAAVWSQSWLLVLDRRAHFFDALRASAAITRGARARILLLWGSLALLALPSAAVEWASNWCPDETAMIPWLVAGAWGLLVWAFQAFAAAAAYHRLSSGRAGRPVPAGVRPEGGDEPAQPPVSTPLPPGTSVENQLAHAMSVIADRWLSRIAPGRESAAYRTGDEAAEASASSAETEKRGLTTAQLATLWYCASLVASILVLTAFFERSPWYLIAVIVLLGGLAVYTQGDHPRGRRALAVGIASGLVLGTLVALVLVLYALAWL